MKTSFATLFSFLLISVSCVKSGSDNFLINPFGKRIEGTEPVKEKTFDGNFDEIKVSSSLKATIVKSEQEKVVVSAPADLLEVLVVSNTDGKLHIHFKDGFNITNVGKINVKIYAKDFTSLHANSSGSIAVQDKFLLEKVTVKASSSGSVKGDLEANDFSFDVSSSGSYSGKVWAIDLDGEASSSGDVAISGESKNSTFDASSSGFINAENMTVENAVAEASSSGTVKVKVKNSLAASANSSGNIDILQTNKLQTQQVKESSGGSVTIR